LKKTIYEKKNIESRILRRAGAALVQVEAIVINQREVNLALLIVNASSGLFITPEN